MKILYITLFALFLASPVFTQTPEQQGLKEFILLDKGDTIRFYISNYNPDSVNSKIFLYLQGSGTLPMVSRTDSMECCFNNYPKKLMKQFPKDYAFVYIQKIGLPYYANTDHYDVSEAFVKRNTVFERTEAANLVLNYLLENIYPNARTIAVLGHSEGSDVAAKLASVNNKITHICFSSGNGTPQVFNDILFIRQRMNKGEITPEEAQIELDTLYAGMKKVYDEPGSTDKYFNGDTYAWHYAINSPAVDNLLRLDIPIFLTIGSNDNKVPVEGSDYIAAEFIRYQKNNLTYKVYLNCDHNYVETLPNGDTIDRWFELFNDFINFVEQQ